MSRFAEPEVKPATVHSAAETDLTRVLAESPRQPERPNFAFWASIFVPAAVVASFYFWIAKYSCNFPYFDDFEVILDFLNRFLTTASISEKIRLLFEQHSEHRVVFDRAIALLEYFLIGKIDFRSLVLIGNAALAIILILFYKVSQKPSRLPLLYLAPAAMIVFNFRYCEASFWPTAALQNIWVLGFAFLALYFLFQTRAYSVWIAGLFGWLATFTSGNGAATFLAGAIALAATRQFWSRKSLTWSVLGIAAIGAYFYGYVKPPHHPTIIEPLLNNPISLAGYVLAFLGGAFTQNVTVAIAIGCVLLGFFSYLTFAKYFQRDPIIYSLMVFLLMTSVLSGLARFGFGIEQALVSRYTVVSSVMVASCYLAAIRLAQPRMQTGWYIFIVGAALCFHVTTYSTYLPDKAQEKADFERDYARVTQRKLSHFSYGWPPLDPRREFPRQTLRIANSLGYFHFQFNDEAEILRSLPTNPSTAGAYQFEQFNLVGPSVVAVAGWGMINGVSSSDVIPVIRFKDLHSEKYMVLQQTQRTEIADRARDHTNHRMCGFQTVFNSEEISPGEYSVTLFLAGPDFKTEIDAGTVLINRSAWQFKPIRR